MFVFIPTFAMLIGCILAGWLLYAVAKHIFALSINDTFNRYNRLLIITVTTFTTVGFLGGYAGPVLLLAEADRWPLLGIFVTGPLGSVAGLMTFLWQAQYSDGSET